MRRLVPITVATAVVLASLGAVLVQGKSLKGGYAVASTSAPASALDTVDARRNALMQRIEEGRRAGHLKGLGYMTLLGEHQSVLVAQRRTEVQGVTDAAVRDLNTALDRIETNLDRELQRH
jgi:hypothetical protein